MITPEEAEKTIKYGLLGGLIGFILLVVFVVATGSTFGQRCARVHVPETPEWEACVKRLAKGGKL